MSLERDYKSIRASAGEHAILTDKLVISDQLVRIEALQFSGRTGQRKFIATLNRKYFGEASITQGSI